ncbi:DUF2750 domain-containing protein [Shewanella cyperi]|uniref:DUF2750 domain-containing protein n=1 Tax=Shewanella cyperi TaxID=2814292 RepID=UPI001A95183B|nr:DUF2750 domain-containing protein [Shewanella cyperi]QSX39315.1 DUF2750 domain-containing protein [Shewanella cyperi]
MYLTKPASAVPFGHWTSFHSAAAGGVRRLKVSSGVPQANMFYEEVAETKVVWFGVLPGEILLEFDLKDKKVSFPMWSSKTRIERLKKINPELLGDVEPRSVNWQQFKELFLPILTSEQKVVGVNLSGKNLTGIDMPASLLVKQVEAFW